MLFLCSLKAGSSFNVEVQLVAIEIIMMSSLNSEITQGQDWAFANEEHKDLCKCSYENKE